LLYQSPPLEKKQRLFLSQVTHQVCCCPILLRLDSSKFFFTSLPSSQALSYSIPSPNSPFCILFGWYPKFERNKVEEKEALTDLCQIGMHSFSLPFETGQVEARNLFHDAAK
jgi:hypothetical protein